MDRDKYGNGILFELFNGRKKGLTVVCKRRSICRKKKMRKKGKRKTWESGVKIKK